METKKTNQNQSEQISKIQQNKELAPQEKSQIQVRITQQGNLLNRKEILELQHLNCTDWKEDSFPSLFAAMTVYMIGKMGKYRRACQFVVINRVVLNHDGIKDLGILLSLNSNIEPSLLGFVIFQQLEVSPDIALESLLKFINQRCEIQNTVLYCENHMSYEKIINEYNALYSKNIILQPNFSQKEATLKSILLNPYIMKHPYQKKKALESVLLLLQEKDQKKFLKILNFFKDKNPEGYNTVLNGPRNFKFIFELPYTFFGFFLFKKYSHLIEVFVKKLSKLKFTNEVEVINQILQLQYEEMELNRDACADLCAIFQSNSRVKDLADYFQPKPVQQFLQNYSKSLSFKLTKVENFYVLGGKAASAYVIKKNYQGIWECQCAQFVRLGVPCEHLIKICSVEKLNYGDYIDLVYRIGFQKPYIRLD